MKFLKLDIPGVFLIEPDVFSDDRGFFMETWRENTFRKNVADLSFVQENHSRSAQGILRGIHYQISHSQGKLVRVINGSVFDVAVDLRKSSPHFGKWTGAVLSAESKQSLWIPPGFGHGFYVLSPKADFIYKCTAYYAPEFERCIRWDDPDLAIQWPLIDDTLPLLSPKDQAGDFFKNAEVFE